MSPEQLRELLAEAEYQLEQLLSLRDPQDDETLHLLVNVVEVLDDLIDAVRLLADIPAETEARPEEGI